MCVPKAAASPEAPLSLGDQSGKLYSQRFLTGICRSALVSSLATATAYRTLGWGLVSLVSFCIS